MIFKLTAILLSSISAEDALMRVIAIFQFVDFH